VPVLEVDGRTVGGAEAGPVTRRLTELFRERTRTGGTPVV
jgi:branched-subunit amino acid aminotransferase/4-amino-4-deoxychorismate lyase